MAERKRSNDGRRETKELFGADGTISHSGRAGGRHARQTGTKDELKRVFERPAGITRVSRSDQDQEGD